MRDLIVKLAKHITDCMDVALGQTKMDETRPEYWMLSIFGKPARMLREQATRRSLPCLSDVRKTDICTR